MKCWVFALCIVFLCMSKISSRKLQVNHWNIDRKYCETIFFVFFFFFFFIFELWREITCFLWSTIGTWKMFWHPRYWTILLQRNKGLLWNVHLWRLLWKPKQLQNRTRMWKTLHWRQETKIFFQLKSIYRTKWNNWILRNLPSYKTFLAVIPSRIW